MLSCASPKLNTRPIPCGVYSTAYPLLVCLLHAPPAAVFRPRPGGGRPPRTHLPACVSTPQRTRAQRAHACDAETRRDRCDRYVVDCVPARASASPSARALARDGREAPAPLDRGKLSDARAGARVAGSTRALRRAGPQKTRRTARDRATYTAVPVPGPGPRRVVHQLLHKLCSRAVVQVS